MKDADGAAVKSRAHAPGDRRVNAILGARSAAIATVMPRMPNWQVTGLFCKPFADTMVGIFATVPEGPTGARVTSP